MSSTVSAEPQSREGQAEGGSLGRPLLAIFLTIFVNLIGFGIIIPLLPFYAESLGASDLTVGLLFASYSVCQLVAAPVLGVLSDRYGRRPILLYSLLGTVVSFALLAIAQSLPLFFLARIIDGLSGGNISTARAYIADVTTPENRARGFGIIGASFGLGFILGPALGGFLARWGYSTPAWVAASLALAASGLAWFWLPETAHRTPAGRGNPIAELPELVARPSLGQLLGTDFLFWACFAVYQTTFALFVAHRFGFDVSATGQLLAMMGIVGVIVQLRLVGPVVKRLGERRTLMLGLVLSGIGLGVVSQIHQVVLLIATLVPTGIGMGLSHPSLSSLLSRSVGADEQGRLQGVSGSLESLGRTLGPIWGNGLLGALGEGAAYGSAALVLVLVGLSLTRFKPQPASDQVAAT